MKYTFVSQVEINEGIGVYRKDPLPIVAILPDERRVLLRNEEELYLPPSFEDKKPTSAGYWDFGDGIKVRRTEDGISSGGVHYDYRGWIKLEILAPENTEFILEYQS